MIKDKIKKYIKTLFRIFGYQIIKIPKIIDPQERPFWDRQSEFNVIYEQIKERTVVSKNRCLMIYQLLRHANQLQGDAAEVGVYKGGIAKLIAKISPHKNVYLFDTFSGLPAIPEEINKNNKRFNDISLRSVRSFLQDCPNVTLYQGTFPDTASAIEGKNFSFIHIDADLYRSVKDCLEFFYPRMVKGGVIVIDDYDSWGWPGVKKAVSEFLADKKEYPIITTEIQCAIIKI